MKNLIRILSLLFLSAFIFVSFAQDSSSTGQHHMDMKKHMNDQDSMKHNMMDQEKMDHKNMNHKKMDHTIMDSTKTEMMNKNSIVREGAIDLQAIDENGDGKVFQDMMDWNVISDESGKCPLCGMTLKEVTLEKAKVNLVKNDFKVKEN